MNNIKDYNMQMLDALHSVFWYQGLLEQDGDEWVDNGVCSRPKYTNDCVIVKLIDELRNKKTKYSIYTYEDVTELYEEFGACKQYNVIWMMLVEMFGSCGTSPRTGWVEQREECADFLELVMCIEDYYAKLYKTV